MKKIVGFIFMLAVSLVLSVTTYAADDLGTVIAKVSVDKKKDKKKKKKKKKVKKSKKNKKKKKAKKSKKKNKKVSNATEQTNLKPIKETEEVLDGDNYAEVEKKDLSTVELKVKSASTIWTNEVDITKINIEQTLNELLIGKDGYPSAPAEVVALKERSGSDNIFMMQTAAGTLANYLVAYNFSFNEFKFISKDSLEYLETYVKEKSDLNSYDLNDFLSTIKVVGLDLDITQKQLDAVANGELKVRFRAGSVSWELTGDRGTLIFERVEKKFVNFTMSDVFRACTKHRLVFTSNFYAKVSGLLGSDFVKEYTDTSSNYRYNTAVDFKFSKNTDGEIGVEALSYSDYAKYRETELQISGNVNIDTRVEELAKILDVYTGIDLYSFDTSRISNMLIGDAVQEFNVVLERKLGDSNVRISVINNGEKTFQFSIIFTKKY